MDDIRSPNRKVQHERQSKERFRAAGELLGERFHVGLRPRSDAVGGAGEILHVPARIGLREIGINRPGEDLPDHFDKGIGCRRPVGVPVPDLAHMPALEPCVGVPANLPPATIPHLAQAIDKAAADATGARVELLELSALQIGGGQPAQGA
ncbi:MAG: hypothetical protein LCH88_17350 [Proteobacteria bacterium]|nr:hypothetical protein [Pseudomonadota bacterium]